MGDLAEATPFDWVSPEVARLEIANAILGGERIGERTTSFADPNRISRIIGAITLSENQLNAARSVRLALDEFGGAMLCDPVGTGKTYVALSLAARYSRIAVVAPAVLREMWRQAALTAAVEIAFQSFESLSRGASVDPVQDFLIVDEAHHVRNSRTRRFALLSRLASRGEVLLMSATPIHNRRRDLTTLLSLFLGERASCLTRAEVGRCVVRREMRKSPSRESFPAVEPLQSLGLSEDDSIPELILALPPTLAPSDGGDGGVLVAHSLIRQWASSDAALEGGLRRRLQKSIALIAALEGGTYPTRHELADWCVGEDSVQLSFAGLVSQPVGGCAELLPVVRSHHDALRRLLDRLRLGADDVNDCKPGCASFKRDRERADVVRAIRARHFSAPIVVFSQYADSVEALFRILARDGEVAVLSAAGGRVAGGRMTRAEILNRFAPRASGREPPRRSEVISLLLTTDLLSEGVNLQDAAVVVHLDLPWTPARMEQRLGRIARLGSKHQRVYAYAIRPPASADAVTGIERALRRKMQDAGFVVGAFPSLAPPSTLASAPASTPQLVDETRLMLERWQRTAGVSPAMRLRPCVSSVSAAQHGFIAACQIDGRSVMVGCLEGRISDAPDVVRACMDFACGAVRACDQDEIDGLLRSLSQHLGVSVALSEAHNIRVTGGTSTRGALRRVSRIVSASRPHERPRVVALAERAREAIRRGLRAYGEQQLAALDNSDLPGDQWLEAVIGLGSDRWELTGAGGENVGGVSIVAVITFGDCSTGIALSAAKER